METPTSEPASCCGRRQMLAASGAIAAGVALSGCGNNAERASSAATTNAAAASAAATAGQGVATTDEVPVGSGVIIGSIQAVITQPTEGEFKAFSSICPHQGCPVSQVEGDQIICTCHGSHFDVATGAVVSGPARTGLVEKTVTVDGDEISVS